LAWAHEAGLAARIRLVRVDVAIVRPHAEVSKLNPLGKIPTLVLEDGRVLFDSGVICEYFHIARPEAELFPDGSESRVAALRWQALGDGLMDVLVGGRAERLRPDGTRSDPHVAAYDRKFLNIVNALESEAAQLGNERFSVGHIAIGCALDYADFRSNGVDWREGRPRMTQWQESFLARSSVRATSYSDEY
jgi:glutathione S-transferase